MNSGGALLVIAGVWVLCQVLGGDALTRLGILTDPDAGKYTGSLGGVTVPDQGYSDVPHDAQGRPL